VFHCDGCGICRCVLRSYCAVVYDHTVSVVQTLIFRSVHEIRTV
jgi:hypothetical protein